MRADEIQYRGCCDFGVRDMTAIFIDTETTGLDDCDVIQLATSVPLATPQPPFSHLPVMSQLFAPTKPISIGAMATHHIIESDLAGAARWPGKWTPPGGVQWLIGHGVDFDWKAIGTPNVKRIDTLALSRGLWPDLESHALGALLYFLLPHEQARELLRSAHSADQDVLLCAILLAEILGRRPMHTWDEVWVASEQARIPTRMPLGKYGPKDGMPGMRIDELRHRDPNYVEWCLRQDFDPYLLKALRGEAA